MIHKLTGIVLRKKEWGERDLLLTVLSEEGKCQEIVVKGGGSGRSRRRSHLELFNWIEGTVYHSARRHYLQEVQLKQSWHNLKEELDLVFRLSVFLEIAGRSLQAEERYPEVYHLLLRTLQDLNCKASSFLPEIALIKLAHYLGYLPSFKECSHCHRLLHEEAHWDLEAGLLSCSDCKQKQGTVLPLKYRKAFEFFKVARHQDCEKVHLSTEEQESLKEWIPHFFNPYLDRPLFSFQWALTNRSPSSPERPGQL